MARGDYLVAVTPMQRHELGLGRWAVVSHLHSAGHRDFPGDNAQGLPMRIRCRVIERPTRTTSVSDPADQLGPDQLALDQAARTALGIPSQFDRDKVKVSLARLEIPVRQRIAMLFARLCGVNEVFFRVGRPHPIDLDQSAIGRVIPDALPLLGTDYGNKINIDSVVPTGTGGWRSARISVTVLELTQTMVDRRKHQVAAHDNVHDAEGKAIDGIRRRFVDTEEALGVAPDSPSIWLSQPQRQALQSPSTHPVLVTRHLPSFLAKEVRDVGIAFFIALIALQQVLPGANSWWRFVGSAAVSALAAIGLAVISARSRAN